MNETKCYQKIKDGNGIWSDNQNVILQAFSDELYLRFKNDPNVNIHEAISLSRDILAWTNQWLTPEVKEDEVWQAVKQVGPLKAPRLDDIHAIFLS